jgi:hypothetical protein
VAFCRGRVKGLSELETAPALTARTLPNGPSEHDLIARDGSREDAVMKKCATAKKFSDWAAGGKTGTLQSELAAID